MFCRRPCKSLVKGEKDSPDARFRRSAHCRTCQNLQLTRVPLGGGSCLRRTGHPFTVSGPCGPSQKIECVFSASPETIRREPREFDLRRSVGNRRTWQSARCVILEQGLVHRSTTNHERVESRLDKTMVGLRPTLSTTNCANQSPASATCPGSSFSISYRSQIRGA